MALRVGWRKARKHGVRMREAMIRDLVSMDL